MLGGTGTDSTKFALGYLTLNLCFCIRWDLCVTLCIPVLLGCETSMHYFSYSNGTGTDSIKSTLGHVTSNMCFSIWWDMHVT
jgi:hypothetical protein